MAGKSGMIFAPGYHDGQTPHGVWKTFGPSFVPDGWPGGDPNSSGSPFDVAFAVVEKHAGQSLEQTVKSALNLKIGTRLPVNVTVVGYPQPGQTYHGKPYANKPYKAVSTANAFKQSWMIIQCLGIPAGFSGGPWIITGTQDVIGVIGGYGQNLPATDPRNYSIRFTDKVEQAYQRAVAHS